MCKGNVTAEVEEAVNDKLNISNVTELLSHVGLDDSIMDELTAMEERADLRLVNNGLKAVGQGKVVQRILAREEDQKKLLKIPKAYRSLYAQEISLDKQRRERKEEAMELYRDKLALEKTSKSSKSSASDTSSNSSNSSQLSNASTSQGGAPLVAGTDGLLRKRSKCFTCNQRGHISSVCPSNLQHVPEPPPSNHFDDGGSSKDSMRAPTPKAGRGRKDEPSHTMSTRARSAGPSTSGASSATPSGRK